MIRVRWRCAALWFSRSTLSLALLLTACGGNSEPEAPAARRRDAARVEPVSVVVVERRDAARRISVTGQAEPLRTVSVLSQLSGVLSAVNVEEGDRVSAGQVLARILVPDVDAQLRSAEVAVANARSNAQRLATLFTAGVVTATENEVAQASLAATTATYEQLRLQSGFSTIRAPMSGVVLERRLERGDLAAPQARLFTIADLSTIVVRVPVSELVVTTLREGSTARVSFDALPGRVLTGRIRRIFPAADSSTRLVPVEVALSGAAARDVKPGFLGRVEFALSTRENVLLVPGTAVLENPRGAVVYVVANGLASLREVERGTTIEGNVEIVSGLTEGDSVVVAGANLLRDGARVRVVSPDRPRAADTAVTTIGQRP
jgi:membrane fusion protein, multidrug efflux system